MGRTAFAVLTLSTILLTAPAAIAADATTNDITSLFRPAAAGVDRLQVYEVSGIVIIRGRVADRAQAEALTAAAYQLGFQRVANLVQTVTHDDAGLTRAAERELTIHRALDGCSFNVRTDGGVLRVAGKVRHELQKDVAYQVLRSIDGVRAIDMQLTTF
jgi:osmotically-inducible protein OsmY